jgi:hypothetical protein
VSPCVETVATVIEPDGLTQTRCWQPDDADASAMYLAGIANPQTGPCRIDLYEGGLFAVSLTSCAARELRSWTPLAGSPWSTDGPTWVSRQRGESALWLHLPSGTWLGIAPADLEEGHICPSEA